MPANTFLRRSSGATANQEFSANSNYRNEQLTAQGLPPYAQLSIENKGWQVMDTTATAAVVVRPSTVAGLTLYNNNASATNICFVIDTIKVFNLVTTAALSDWSVWACVHPTGMTAPTADITAIKSMSGLATAYSGGAIVDTGATVVDNGWFPISNNANVTHGVGVTPGHALSIPVDGRFIIPPTAAISVNVVASITGLTFTHGFSWWEMELVTGTPG